MKKISSTIREIIRDAKKGKKVNVEFDLVGKYLNNIYN